MSVSAITDALMPHLILAPIMLPMFTAAIMLLLGEKNQRAKLVINLFSTFIGLIIAVQLLRWSKMTGSTASMGSPAARRICAATMSMPVTCSVTACSTCNRVFTSKKVNPVLGV